MLTFALLFLLFVIVLIGIIAFLVHHTNQRNLANAKPREKTRPKEKAIIREKPAYIRKKPVHRYYKKGTLITGEYQDDFPDHININCKKHFLTTAEQAFYALLLSSISYERFRVFANVRLPDLFKAKKNLSDEEREEAESYYFHMHLDFLIVSVPDFQPLLGIELDGYSHSNLRQQSLDRRKEMIFRSGKLPLIRFKNEEELSPSDLRAYLRPYLDL